MRSWAAVVALAATGCSDGGKSEPMLACLQEAGNSDPAGAARIDTVALPSRPEGTMRLRLRVSPASAATTARIDAEVLHDDGGSWRPARAARLKDDTASARQDEITLLWSSLEDLGFHQPVRASLRLRVAGGPACVVTLPPIDNLRAAARNVEHYMVNYGALDDSKVAMAKKYDLVIVHPQHAQLDRGRILEIQRGVDPNDPADDVLVLGYVSIGEDMRSAGLTDEETKRDPRFRGDGSGPRVDPRGAGGGGKPLTGISPTGAASNGGSGWASFYLDDNSVQSSPGHQGDGIPDRNPLFGSYFVNAGDPAWFDVVNGMKLDGPDKISGLREVLTSDYGRGLNCDGVFLDTIDTAAPNDFTAFGQSPNPTRFEWTAPGFSSFIARVHSSYPERLVLQNRGLFFFDPRHPHYAFTTRGSIDFAMFESYRLNSNKWQQWDPFFYPDNRFNLAPKLMAEANRDDGFRVLSLGYAEGPGLTPDALVYKSTAGLDSLLEDIRVTQDLAGFRHYLSNSMVDLVNTFVMDQGTTTDSVPPRWTSTFNDHEAAWPTAPLEPTARVGIQQAEPGPGQGQITVRWDVAMDRNRVGYALYSSQVPFDFAGDPLLHRANRVVLSPTAPAAYRQGVAADRYANEAVVSGLQSGRVYQLVVRAFDDSPAQNEETNTVVITTTAR